ncbi:MAG: hypothetical protein C5B55_06030 [Blastocatellia bacterium]|nr:MAG: hypothetical protein C5B55_06030 [Blastocatellia bacterium]
MTLFKLAIFCSLMILAFAPAAAQDQQPQASATGTISGRVVNESGQPLYEATVSIRSYVSTGTAREMSTDRDGKFQFSGLPSVVYLLSAGFPAYTIAPRDPDSTQTTSYRVGDNVTLIMIKGGVITGKVTTSAGEPVVGVRVRAQMIRDSFGQQSRYGAAMRELTTDDRGVYRIYGLPTGTYLVMAGAGGLVAYRNDSPTYAPSATRDNAAEVSVQAGQETSNVDIRYRGDQGHSVTGVATNGQGSETTPFVSITLTSTLDEGSQSSETTYQSSESQSFSFSGIADGDYDVTAQSYSNNGDRWISEPKRIKIRGADVTGVELITKPLASISGRVVIEDSTAPECKNKRRALVTETLISAWHNEKEAAKDKPQFVWSLGGPAYPNQQGEIALRNLAAGQYQIISRLFAKYWYLRSITLPASTGSGTGNPQSSKQTDAVANWINVRSGDRLSGLTVTLSEGAASLQGQLKLNEGEALPGRLYVYLVPAEHEKEADVLQFFAAPITPDKKLAVNHIPPGRYLIVAQPALEGPMPAQTRLRLPDERETRMRLLRDAEQTKIEIEFKPCQNVTDYELALPPIH